MGRSFNDYNTEFYFYSITFHECYDHQPPAEQGLLPSVFTMTGVYSLIDMSSEIRKYKSCTVGGVFLCLFV